MERSLLEWVRKLYFRDAVMQETVCLDVPLLKRLCACDKGHIWCWFPHWSKKEKGMYL